MLHASLALLFQLSSKLRNSSVFSVRVLKRLVRRSLVGCEPDTGVGDFRRVSSHDLRRRFAQRLLVGREMNPRVVMAVGGWDSFAAIEPYLTEPTEQVIDKAFAEVST